MWVNGQQITSFATEQYPSQNGALKIMNDGYLQLYWNKTSSK